MNTLDVLTEIAQKYRFTATDPDNLGSVVQLAAGKKFIKFRKERTRRTLGVRAVNDGRGLGIIEISVSWRGPEIWINRSKVFSLCEPNSMHRLEKYFRRAK